MKRNGDLLRHFMKQKPTLTQKLAWQATTVEEHQAWRRRFAQRLRMLVGRMPSKVPLQVDCVEELETEGFTRRKVYIQSEEHSVDHKGCSGR